MHPVCQRAGIRRAGQSFCAILLLLSLTVVISACGGDAQLQQQASQHKSQLDALLQHAQAIGVPRSLLDPILYQEQQLSSTGAPFSPFSSQPVNSYYSNLATRYAQLLVQTQGVITTTTERYQLQALQDLQNFQTALTHQRAQGLPVQQFAQQFRQDQELLANAKTPKAYAAISQHVKASRQALDLLQVTAEQLNILNIAMQQMQKTHLDVTAIQAEYQNDQLQLAAATNSLAFQQLSTLINAQYQQAIADSLLALPYVAAAKLNEFITQLQLFQSYGLDVSAYQKRLDTDRQTMSHIKSLHNYQAFVQQVDADIALMHNDLVPGEAAYLVRQFHQEVNAWGQAHLYHDSFNGQNYVLDAAYMGQGIGSDLDAALNSASTPDDYQNVLDEVQNDLFNLHMLEADYSDKTPYNQVHATDLQMLAHYQLQNKQVLMISLVEQVMRLYDNGKLVKSFLVTTGRNELPSLPGVWPVLDRLSPTVFKSPDPPGSPYWYPDTPINYAILYHAGGYFVHDAWWRVNYGPGTQFPHYDTGGDESFAGDGSHGCVNVQEDQAAWVYNHTNWNTMIVIY
jgi:hypothetical protein